MSHTASCFSACALLLCAAPASVCAQKDAAPVVVPPLGTRGTRVPVALSAQWGEGLVFSAGDLFSLQLRSRAQLLFGFSLPSDGAIAAGAADVINTDLAVRRMRLVFSGHLFTRALRYNIQLGLATRDMEADLLVPLRDAYVTWQPLRDLGVRFGQMKVPYGKQRVVSSSALQLVDRSIVTSALNLDRDVGIYLMSEDFLGLGGRLQYQAGIFGGRGRNRGPSADALLYAVRLQVRPFGPFDDLSEADHSRTPTPRLSIGGGVAQNWNSYRQRSTVGDLYKSARFTYLHAGADVHFKWRGLSVLSEFFYRSVDRPDSTDQNGLREYARPALGFYAQAGFLFPVPFEIVARYGELRPYGATDPAFFLEREAGGGLNFYFWEHTLKIQGDYFALFGQNPTAARHQARVQVQIYF